MLSRWVKTKKTKQKQNKTDNKKSFSLVQGPEDGQASNTENLKQQTLYFRDEPKKKLWPHTILPETPNVESRHAH